MEYLSWVFVWFEAIFGLKIILEKSKLIPIGVVSNMEDLARVLGCMVSNLLATYFGFPLGA